MQTPSNLLFSKFQAQEFNQLCQEICNVFETSPAELAELYRKIDDNFHTHGWPKQFTKRNFFKSKDEKFHDNYQNSPAIAVDLPSLMELKNDSLNKPTITIIGQDPYTKNLCQDMEVGTPYGLHHKDSRETGDTKLYFEIIYDLLKDLNCRIYLTDAYKIWVRDHRGDNSLKPKRRKLLIKDRQRFLQLLKRELDIINPIGLITWGKEAEDAVNQINLEIKHIYFPHPSGSNGREWAKIIDGRVTPENKLKFYKESIKSIKKQWEI